MTNTVPRNNNQSPALVSQKPPEPSRSHWSLARKNQQSVSSIVRKSPDMPRHHSPLLSPEMFPDARPEDRDQDALADLAYPHLAQNLAPDDPRNILRAARILGCEAGNIPVFFDTEIAELHKSMEEGNLEELGNIFLKAGKRQAKFQKETADLFAEKQQGLQMAGRKNSLTPRTRKQLEEKFDKLLRKRLSELSEKERREFRIGGKEWEKLSPLKPADAPLEGRNANLARRHSLPNFPEGSQNPDKPPVARKLVFDDQSAADPVPKKPKIRLQRRMSLPANFKLPPPPPPPGSPENRALANAAPKPPPPPDSPESVQSTTPPALQPPPPPPDSPSSPNDLSIRSAQPAILPLNVPLSYDDWNNKLERDFSALETRHIQKFETVDFLQIDASKLEDLPSDTSILLLNLLLEKGREVYKKAEPGKQPDIAEKITLLQQTLRDKSVKEKEAFKQALISYSKNSPPGALADVLQKYETYIRQIGTEKIEIERLLHNLKEILEDQRYQPKYASSIVKYMIHQAQKPYALEAIPYDFFVFGGQENRENLQEQEWNYQKAKLLGQKEAPPPLYSFPSTWNTFPTLASVFNSSSGNREEGSIFLRNLYGVIAEEMNAHPVRYDKPQDVISQRADAILSQVEQTLLAHKPGRRAQNRRQSFSASSLPQHGLIQDALKVREACSYKGQLISVLWPKEIEDLFNTGVDDSTRKKIIPYLTQEQIEQFDADFLSFRLMPYLSKQQISRLPLETFVQFSKEQANNCAKKKIFDKLTQEQQHIILRKIGLEPLMQLKRKKGAEMNAHLAALLPEVQRNQSSLVPEYLESIERLQKELVKEAETANTNPQHVMKDDLKDSLLDAFVNLTLVFTPSRIGERGKIKDRYLETWNKRVGQNPQPEQIRAFCDYHLSVAFLAGVELHRVPVALAAGLEIHDVQGSDVTTDYTRSYADHGFNPLANPLNQKLSLHFPAILEKNDLAGKRAAYLYPYIEAIRGAAPARVPQIKTLEEDIELVKEQIDFHKSALSKVEAEQQNLKSQVQALQVGQTERPTLEAQLKAIQTRIQSIKDKIQRWNEELIESQKTLEKAYANLEAPLLQKAAERAERDVFFRFYTQSAQKSFTEISKESFITSLDEILREEGYPVPQMEADLP